MNFWIILICVIAVAVLLCFLLAVANFSGERFMDKYHEMNEIYADCKLTPKEFIEFIHKKYFKKDLQFVEISEVAGDAYSKGKLFLSSDTLYRKSLASYTIIAHEMGHALQDEEGNKLKRLNFLRRIGKGLGILMMPLLVLGIILLFFETLFYIGVSFIGVSVFVFILALFVKIKTISIEKDASKKAEMFLSEVLAENQLKRCKKFLNDARLTYWAEFLKILLFWTGVSKKTKLFN